MFASHSSKASNKAKHMICASNIAPNAGPLLFWTWLFGYKILPSAYAFVSNPFFFSVLLQSVDLIIPFTLVVALCHCILGIAGFQTPGNCIKILWSLFSIFCPFSLFTVFPEQGTKQKLWSYTDDHCELCTSSWSSNTTMQQDLWSTRSNSGQAWRYLFCTWNRGEIDKQIYFKPKKVCSIA